MADLVRKFPWQHTPLGPMDAWEPSLLRHLELMLDARFPMFLCWGADLHLFYNEAFETALVGKGNCIGRPVHAVFREIWSEVKPFFQRAMTGEATFREDLPLRLIRNSTVAPSWWCTSYSPVRVEDGSVGGVLAIVYETTRRVAAEDRLRSREQALLAVTDSVPSLLWRCDAGGRFIWSNPALEAYVGRKSLTGQGWEGLVHLDDLPGALDLYAACVRTGRTYECQQRLIDGNGDARWFMVRARQVLDDDGHLVGWFGSASDIDDWRRAVDQQSHHEDLLHRFYDSKVALMWVGSVASREIHALNPGSHRTWAMPSDGSPVKWESWISFAHPDDRPLLSGLFDRAAAGEVAQIRFRSLAADGSIRRFHITGFWMPGEDGGAERVGGMVVEVASNDDPRIYLVEPGASSGHRLAASLSRKGYRVRVFGDLTQFQQHAADLAPGCVVLSMTGEIEPILRAAAVLRVDRRLPFIAIGEVSHRLHDVVQLMKIGASDVLDCPEPEDVAAASQAALAIAFGKVSESRAPTDARQKIEQLSHRERQVLDGLVAGGTNKSIAKALDLSPRTVETYRAQLMDRLGVSTLAELVRLAAEGRMGAA